MTHEEIMNLGADEIEARGAEIKELIENADENTDIEALSAEVDAIEERKLALKEELKNDLAAVAEGAGEERNDILPKEENHMATMLEVRSSHDYIEAFANGLKKGDKNMTEARALLTELATDYDGTAPVPTIVYDIVKNAWEKNGITRRVKKVYLQGILKVGFEISADPAVVHAEGASAPSEEKLVLGVVSIDADYIKKWITISDKLLAYDGEKFLQYIYDELTYQIAKKASDELIGKILACGTVSTNTPTVNVAVASIDADVALGTVAKAVAALSDQATDPVIIMNKQTWSAFKDVQYAGSYGVDPFEGLEVVFSSKLTAYSAATTGVPYMIVGDLAEGAIMNLPEGDGITIIKDELTYAEKDLIKVVGKQLVGSAVIGPNAFAVVKKDA